MAKRRRRRIRRIRYTPRHRRARRNPGLTSTSILLLAGAGLAGYFIWKKVKAGQVAVKPATPSGTSIGVKIGDSAVTAQIPTSGYPGSVSYGTLGSGGLGSLG